MKRKFLLPFFVVVVISSSTGISSASASDLTSESNDPTYEITTIEEFHSAVEGANSDGVVTPIEAIRIDDETSPIVLAVYSSDIVQEAIESVEDIEVVLTDDGSGSYTGSQTIQLDENNC